MQKEQGKIKSLLVSSVSACALVLMGGTGAFAQKQPNNTPQQGDGAQIHVQQKSPDIHVQQPAPQITVQQPPPQVSVSQQKPQVTVTQPNPNVQVQEAKPNVNVIHEGQAQVTVKGAEQAAGSTDNSSQQPAQGNPGTAPQGNSLAQMSRDDLVGKKLYGNNGTEVATIDDVTIANGKVSAVEVDVGGFLGIGSKRVAVPIDSLELREGNRIVSSSMTADQIRNLPAEANKK